MNLQFSPPLRAAPTLVAPGDSTLRFFATLPVAQFVQTIKDGARIQLWTNYVSPSQHEWREVDFIPEPVPASSGDPDDGSVAYLNMSDMSDDLVLLKTEPLVPGNHVTPGWDYGYTYRILTHSGVQWLGDYGANGVISVLHASDPSSPTPVVPSSSAHWEVSYRDDAAVLFKSVSSESPVVRVLPLTSTLSLTIPATSLPSVESSAWVTTRGSSPEVFILKGTSQTVNVPVDQGGAVELRAVPLHSFIPNHEQPGWSFAILKAPKHLKTLKTTSFIDTITTTEFTPEVSGAPVIPQSLYIDTSIASIASSSPNAGAKLNEPHPLTPPTTDPPSSPEDSFPSPALTATQLDDAIHIPALPAEDESGPSEAQDKPREAEQELAQDETDDPPALAPPTELLQAAEIKFTSLSKAGSSLVFLRQLFTTLFAFFWSFVNPAPPPSSPWPEQEGIQEVDEAEEDVLVVNEVEVVGDVDATVPLVEAAPLTRRASTPLLDVIAEVVEEDEVVNEPVDVSVMEGLLLNAADPFVEDKVESDVKTAVLTTPPMSPSISKRRGSVFVPPPTLVKEASVRSEVEVAPLSIFEPTSNSSISLLVLSSALQSSSSPVLVLHSGPDADSKDLRVPLDGNSTAVAEWKTWGAEQTKAWVVDWNLVKDLGLAASESLALTVGLEVHQ